MARLAGALGRKAAAGGRHRRRKAPAALGPRASSRAGSVLTAGTLSARMGPGLPCARVTARWGRQQPRGQGVAHFPYTDQGDAEPYGDPSRAALELLETHSHPWSDSGPASETVRPWGFSTDFALCLLPASPPGCPSVAHWQQHGSSRVLGWNSSVPAPHCSPPAVWV